MRVIIMAGVLCILLAVSACGQIKVGSPFSFLEINPSVRAIGMGEISAPSVAPYAFTINPASLGFIHEDDDMCISAYPVHAQWGDVNPVTFRSYAVSGHLLNGVMSSHRAFAINVGYHYNRYIIGFPVTTYANPEGTGEYDYIGDHAHTITVAMGIRDFFDIGIGLAGTYFRESASTGSIHGDAYHLGVLLRVPPERFTFLWRENDTYRWRVSPRIGIARRNFGPDVRIGDTYAELRGTSYYGGALDIGLELNTPEDLRLLWGISPAFEYQDKGGNQHYKYGIEMSLYEAISGRWGYIEYKDNFGYNTWGISLNSKGLVSLIVDTFFNDTKAVNKPVVTFFRNKIGITFDFAHKKTTISEDHIDYYSLSLSL